MEADRIVLARRPTGSPRPEDFRIEPFAVEPLADDEARIRTRWLSIDPMLALLIADAPLGGAITPLPIGTPIPGAAIGQVIESRSPALLPGDWVEGRLGWQTLSTATAASLRKVDPGAGPHALAAGGLTGFTAWVGLELAGELTGRTILVSGAAGAVGSIVGQLATHKGARAIGLARSADRRAYLVDELGFHAALDPQAIDYDQQLAQLGPIDLLFDNVGGDTLRRSLPALQRHALILVCGLMSSYTGGTDAGAGAALLQAIMAKSLRVIGFNNRDYLDRFPHFEQEMEALLRDGRIKDRLNVLTGLQGAIRHLGEMFDDQAIGKRIAALDWH